MHGKCTTNTQKMHNKCTTNAQKMHSKFIANSQQILGNSQLCSAIYIASLTSPQVLDYLDKDQNVINVRLDPPVSDHASI